MRFTDVTNPALGGDMTLLLDGNEPNAMYMADNIAIDTHGHIVVLEDPGSDNYVSRVHAYDIGTGTLVAPRLVLSALHVVANRRTDPPQPYPGELTLDFPDFTTTGAILAGAWDRATDWVLIECSEAPPATPMRPRSRAKTI